MLIPATGKAPAEVAARARTNGIPCVAICGTVLDPLADLFSSAVSLDEIDAGFDPSVTRGRSSAASQPESPARRSAAPLSRSG